MVKRSSGGMGIASLAIREANRIRSVTLRRVKLVFTSCSVGFSLSATATCVSASPIARPPEKPILLWVGR